MIKTFYRS